MKIWEKNLEKLKQFKKIHRHTNVPRNWDQDPVLAQWVENIRTSRRRLPSQLITELKKLKFNFEHKISNEWQNMYAQLVSFWKKNGHTYIPQDKDHEELFAWVEKQKQAKTKLPVKQIALLDKIGFDWGTITRKRNSWEFMYLELKKFRRKYGHTKVLRDDKEHSRLATWVQNTRRRASLLDADQKKRLDSLGFLWSEDIKKQVEAKWMMRYNELKEFKKRFGHCNVPIKWKENKKLSQWVSENRLREKNKGLLPHRKKLLDKIGFSWSDDLLRQYDDYWNQMFRKLKEQAVKPRKGKIYFKWGNDDDLKMWASSQRIMIRQGLLSPDKEKKLQAIGFIAKELHKNQWERMYQDLKQFITRYGNKSLIKRSTHSSLAAWAVRQRQEHSKGTLSKDRIDKLSKTGFMWSNQIQHHAWTQNYHQFLAFQKKYKHANVPATTPRYKSLNHWLNKQRQKWKSGKMDKTKFELLNKAGFSWDKSLQLRWDNMHDKLVTFKKQFKHLKVSAQTHPSLFRWITKQRGKFRSGTLAPDRIKKLKDMGLILNRQPWKTRR